MSIQKPPFCEYGHCPNGHECSEAQHCLGHEARIEYPDGKTGPLLKTPAFMESLLRGANEPKTAKQMGSRTQAQDAAGPTGTRGRSELEAPQTLATSGDTPSQVNQRNITSEAPRIDLSGLRSSIDKACETIDYLREREAELKLLLQKIVNADTRYQSAQIALRADGRFANMQEAEVASEKMRAAIEDARKAL